MTPLARASLLVLALALVGGYARAQASGPLPRPAEATTIVAAVKTKLSAACYERINSEGESHGLAYLFARNDYPKVERLRAQGLKNVRALGASCADLTRARVPERASVADVIRAVEASGGFREATFAFYDADQAKSSFEAALERALEALPLD